MWSFEEAYRSDGADEHVLEAARRVDEYLAKCKTQDALETFVAVAHYVDHHATAHPDGELMPQLLRHPDRSQEMIELGWPRTIICCGESGCDWTSIAARKSEGD